MNNFFLQSRLPSRESGTSGRGRSRHLQGIRRHSLGLKAVLNQALSSCTNKHRLFNLKELKTEVFRRRLLLFIQTMKHVSHHHRDVPEVNLDRTRLLTFLTNCAVVG